MSKISMPSPPRASRSAMITATWMYGDAGSAFLGEVVSARTSETLEAIAKYNPWKWSRRASLPEIMEELERLPHRARPIRIRVQSQMEEPVEHQSRSWMKVEQRFQAVDGAIAALHELYCTIPDSGLVSRPLSLVLSEGENSASFASETPIHQAVDLSPTLSGAGSSPLDVLRMHLTTGSPVLAQWMWGDAGLSVATLPHYTVISEKNPWRWSKALPLDSVVAELDNYLGSKNASRPVRLLVHSSSSGADAKCVRFATTVATVACAGSIAWEIHFMVCALDQEPPLPEPPPDNWKIINSSGEESFSSLHNILQEQKSMRSEALAAAQGVSEKSASPSFKTQESFHSFATEALAVSRPSRRWSFQSSRSNSSVSFKSMSGSHTMGAIITDAASDSPHCAAPSAPLPVRRPPTNTNRVSQYAWLSSLLKAITDGSAKDMAQDLATGHRATPLFVVAGFCPNAFTGMQAVVYNQLARGIDFWWAKPQEDHPLLLERATLDLHNSGKHKNAAGKSRAVYAPLAEKFRGVTDQGDFSFGVEGGRAFVEDKKQGTAPGRRMLLYFIWQENWSSLFARRKFIEGKMCYQWSKPDGRPEARFFARQYRIEEGQLDIADAQYEEEVTSLLPPDGFQEMYEM